MGLIGWKNRAIDFITEISSQNMPEINTFNCFLAYVIKSEFGCLFWQPEGCRAETAVVTVSQRDVFVDESVGFGLQQLIWIAQTANWLSKPVSCLPVLTKQKVLWLYLQWYQMVIWVCWYAVGSRFETSSEET